MADGRKTFSVSLVTPEGAAYEGEAEMLIVPGAAGEIGVLARHAPLVAMLKAGSTRIHLRYTEEVLEFATGPGFFKVEQDRALALVDDAVDAHADETGAPCIFKNALVLALTVRDHRREDHQPLARRHRED